MLRDLAERHKVSIQFPSAAVEGRASSRVIEGRVDGASVRQVVSAVSYVALEDGHLPWTAEKSTLRFHDPDAIILVTHDVSHLRHLLVDDIQFRQAIENSLNDPWEADDDKPEPEFIADLTPDSLTSHCTYRQQAALADLLNRLRKSPQRGPRQGTRPDGIRPSELSRNLFDRCRTPFLSVKKLRLPSRLTGSCETFQFRGC